MPPVDRGIELHPRVTALPGRFCDFPHQITGAEPILGLAVVHRFGPPVPVLNYGLHEVVARTHRVIGVLEEDGRIGIAIERRVITGRNQGMSFLLFTGLAANEA